VRKHPREMDRRLLTFWAAASLTAAPAGAQETAPQVPVAQPQGSVRPGDDQLSCEQLAAESMSLQAEMESMTREITEAAAGQMRAARSAQGMGAASGLTSMIPVIGPLLGTATSMAARAQIQGQQNRMLEMSERMLTRGTEIGQRINRVEILRSARCGTGHVQSTPRQPQPEVPPAAQEPRP